MSVPALDRVVRRRGPEGGRARAASVIVPDPAGQAELRRRFPAREAGDGWPATCRPRQTVVDVLEAAAFHTVKAEQRKVRRRGVSAVLDWLADEDGQTWQQRWRASGVESVVGNDWVEVPLAWHAAHGRPQRSMRELVHIGVQVLTCTDVIRPELGWMVRRRSGFLRQAMAEMRDPAGFAALAETLAACQVSELVANTVTYQIAQIMAAKGGAMMDITVGDCVHFQDTRPLGRAHGADTLLYELLRRMGAFPADAPATIRVFGRASGQLTVAELVDRREIACRPVRDLLVDYLSERQPSVDYATLADAAYILAGLFWQDLEVHHPGIDSLDLAPQVARDWKQRLQTTVKTVRDEAGNLVDIQVPRRGYRSILIKVRAFYLDIAQWAVEDPARWARWAAPCPIKAAECERAKARRRHKADMDARTRDQLPVLPSLVAAVDQRRETAARLLAAARDTADGDVFTVDGQTLRRQVRRSGNPRTIWAVDPDTARSRNLTAEEDDTFWTWATVEVLRHTGIRIEELLELTHHSLVQYRLPSTGELVPLLQITPSKTDTERLLLVSPELADVLAAIVTRVRAPDGAVPCIASYDALERTWRPELPLLFQRWYGNEHRPISRALILRLLGDAVAALGATGPTGKPITFKPHDFRRMFITEAVLHGLPPHIAQVIAGHADIQTTLGYKAVYPTEAIEAHRAFLARRRSLRPSEEYRTPTEEEWEDFLGHFQRRKLSVGTCGRAYDTTCQHEHACIRCPMLRPDPAHRTRLTEIRDNLIDRIDEAQAQHWLGEIEGLRISLAAAQDKLAQLDRIAKRHGTVMLGMPTIGEAAGRHTTTEHPNRP